MSAYLSHKTQSKSIVFYCIQTFIYRLSQHKPKTMVFFSAFQLQEKGKRERDEGRERERIEERRAGERRSQREEPIKAIKGPGLGHKGLNARKKEIMAIRRTERADRKVRGSHLPSRRCVTRAESRLNISLYKKPLPTGPACTYTLPHSSVQTQYPTTNPTDTYNRNASLH